MTLEQWLHEATGIFPAGVQKRLAQEYRAHLDESVAAGGSGDPVALFGQPKITKRKLKSLYTDQNSWTYLFDNRLRFFPLWLNSLLAFWEFAKLNDAIWLLVCLAIILLILISTRFLPHVRCVNSRQYLVAGLLGLSYAINILSDAWGSLVIGSIGVVVICAVGWIGPQSDARLRRTLVLEG